MNSHVATTGQLRRNDKFLETKNMSRLNQEEMDNLNSY